MSSRSVRLHARNRITHLLANDLIGSAATHIKLLGHREVVIAIYSIRIGIAVHVIII